MRSFPYQGIVDVDLTDVDLRFSAAGANTIWHGSIRKPFGYCITSGNPPPLVRWIVRGGRGGWRFFWSYGSPSLRNRPPLPLPPLGTIIRQEGGILNSPSSCA